MPCLKSTLLLATTTILTTFTSAQSLEFGNWPVFPEICNATFDRPPFLRLLDTFQVANLPTKIQGCTKIGSSCKLARDCPAATEAECRREGIPHNVKVDIVYADCVKGTCRTFSEEGVKCDCFTACPILSKEGVKLKCENLVCVPREKQVEEYTV